MTRVVTQLGWNGRSCGSDGRSGFRIGLTAPFSIDTYIALYKDVDPDVESTGQTS